jgi:hypothetical protein
MYRKMEIGKGDNEKGDRLIFCKKLPVSFVAKAKTGPRY